MNLWRLYTRNYSGKYINPAAGAESHLFPDDCWGISGCFACTPVEMFRFWPRNNFYYFSFVWNVENRQNRLRIPKEYFILSGLLVHRGMWSHLNSYTHCAHHRRKWKYLTLGEIMRESGWTSSFPLCLSLVFIFFSFSATLSSSIWGTGHPNTDIPFWSRQRKGLMRMLLEIWTPSINWFVLQ